MSAPNPSTALARVIVDELVRNGLRTAVLAPGSRSGALALALASDERVDLHVAIDERSAGFFALGVAKAGDLAVVATTSGTAAANLYPAVVEADAACVPLVLLTADRPPKLRFAGANQTIDQVHLYGNRVRWFAQLGAGEETPDEVGTWRSVVCQASALANGHGGCPGPVQLNVAFAEPVVPVTDDGRTAALPYKGALAGRADGRPWTEWHPPTAPSPVEVAVDGRTLVVLGDEATPDQAEHALEAGAVVIAEAHSGCRVPGTVSTAHHLLASPAFSAFALPERLIQVGRVGLSRNLAALIERAGDRTVVSRARWADPERSAHRLIPAIAFRPGRADSSWVEGWQRGEKAARVILDEALDQSKVPDEARTARDVAGAVPAGGILAVGSSMPVRDLDWFMAPRRELVVISNRGASGIDGFVSTALGASAGSSRKVVALTGDLGMLHDQNGLLTERLPDLVMVVVNNHGGGIFSFLPQADFPDHFERLFASPRGIKFSALAALHGLEYRTIETAAQLGPAIHAGLEAGGVHLLEIQTERQANVDRHRELTALVVAEVSRLFEG